ncbi:Uma2 family endonuclease [Cyanobacterium aponinum AL20118]|uniref:Uma2 family endonuclease n=1 Tax=Cyanobacterium aponinum AL20115 TaxID=3090662 RepID=A0AAF0ZE15_9CHRO|nr:Uma2 family endonuclease [Cyanobacterium aponinum]WPF90000.1 Uma2 family endonuclease [Cyanobacterium aponinum AL20115]
MIAQLEKKYYSVEEYFELEETAEYKSEYHDGKIIPMTGGTTNHNKIALNFCYNFKSITKGKNYEIYINDVRLSIPHQRRYTYPDIMIIKDKPIYEGDKQTTVTNPLIIIEVLSNSTENYDKGEKFKSYRSIKSFQEYILIDQYSFSVEQFIKESEGEWKFKEYLGENQVLKLGKIDFELSFSDIYEGVNFVESI